MYVFLFSEKKVNRRKELLNRLLGVIFSGPLAVSGSICPVIPALRRSCCLNISCLSLKSFTGGQMEEDSEVQ